MANEDFVMDFELSEWTDFDSLMKKTRKMSANITTRKNEISATFLNDKKGRKSISCSFPKDIVNKFNYVYFGVSVNKFCCVFCSEENINRTCYKISKTNSESNKNYVKRSYAVIEFLQSTGNSWEDFEGRKILGTWDTDRNIAVFELTKNVNAEKEEK